MYRGDMESGVIGFVIGLAFFIILAAPLGDPWPRTPAELRVKLDAAIKRERAELKEAQRRYDMALEIKVKQ